MPGKRQYYPTKGSVRRSVLTLYHRVLLGATGAISTTTNTLVTSGQTPKKKSGVSAAKTAGKVGRYTLTLDDKYPELLHASGTIIGDTDAAYTTAKGLECFLRNDNVASAGTLDVQFIRTDTGADAEVEDNRTILLKIVVAVDLG